MMTVTQFALCIFEVLLEQQLRSQEGSIVHDVRKGPNVEVMFLKVVMFNATYNEAFDPIRNN